MARVAITVILEGAATERCLVQVSPLAELCAALHAVEEAGHHPASRGWVDGVRGGEPELLDEAARWAPLWGSLRARYFYPLDDGGERGLGEEIAAIADLPVRAFVAMSVEAVIDRDRSLPYDRVLDDPAARALFLEHARRFSARRLALAERLTSDPEGCRTGLLTFLRSFGERAFESEWRHVRAGLREDVHRRRRELRRRGLGVIADVTVTAQERREPHRVVFDKLYQAMARVGDDPLVLLPSAHVGPHVVIKHARGLPIVIQYAAGGPRETPFDEVNRRLRALSDPGRMQLSRALLRGRRTTVDLANYTGMSEPQVSRHLRRLREAGLVRTSREGRLVFYELDDDAVMAIGPDLIAALWR
jgi:DNA-binding transcriptional ArsR family regulator